MNKALFIFAALIIAYLVGLWQGCANNKKQNNSEVIKTQSHTTITTSIDTNIYTLEATPKQPTKSIADTVFLPSIIDTATILKAFYTKNIYNDTITDKNILLAIKDTIFKNQIVYRSINYKILRPDSIITITNTTTIYQKPLKNSIAIGASYNNINNTILPAVQYTHKKTSVGIATNFNNYQLNLKYTIWKN